MVTNEILANQISAALAGETMEMLAHSPEVVQLYIIDLAYKYYCRRMNIQNQLQTTTFAPVSASATPDVFLGREKTSQDLGNNDRLPQLERDFQDWNMAVPATIEVYGRGISYAKQRPVTDTEPNGPQGVYPVLFQGRPHDFEFSGADFESTPPTDPAEY